MRADHSHGWQVRAWCDACKRDAQHKRVWWPKSLFTPLELATLEAPIEPLDRQIKLF